MTETETDPFGGPLRHLKRIAPPWAASGRTVCGRELNDVAAWMDFDEAKALIDKIGRRRSEFAFCQTCLMNHRGRVGDQVWETKPHRVLTDWAEKAGWSGVSDGGQITAEIRALADIVAAHPEEYAEAVQRRLVPDELSSRRSTRQAATR